MAAATSADEFPNIALPARGLERHTGMFLAFFYVLAVLLGLRQSYLWQQQSLFDLLAQVAFPLCLATWALEDMRRRRFRFPFLAGSWLFLFGNILVPGYVIWSRGWRGVGWVVLHLFGLIVLAATTSVVGGILIFGPGWLRALGRG